MDPCALKCVHLRRCTSTCPSLHGKAKGWEGEAMLTMGLSISTRKRAVVAQPLGVESFSASP